MLGASLCCMCSSMFAGKPRWVGNTPKELNDTYRFIEILSFGNTIGDARVEARRLLVQNEQLRRAVTVNVSTGNLQHIDQQIVNGDMVETIQNDITIETSISGQEYQLRAYPVDEYACQKDGQVKLYSLYMVGVADRVTFDHTYKSERYGALPALMSVIPGLGQFYKGSKVKGGLMFAGTALLAGGVILCENQRSDYKNKISEQPKYAQTYNTRSNNWETARNVFIGAAAALWLYNIVDAAVAKGARRVLVKSAGDHDSSLQLQPYAALDDVGVVIRYSF